MTDVNDPRLTTAGLLLESAVALRRRFVEVHARHGLSGAEFDALLRLSRSSGGRLRVSDLAAQAGISLVAAASLADALHDRGLVRRERAADASHTVVAITLEGGIVLEAAAKETAEVIQADLLGPVGDDAAVVEAALRRIRDHLHPQATIDAR